MQHLTPPPPVAISTEYQSFARVSIRRIDSHRQLAPEPGGRLERVATMLAGRHKRVRLIADSGIRSHTLSDLRRTDAGLIVPGWLVLQWHNLAERFQWLRGL